MKQWFRRAGHFIRTHRVAVKRRYDTAGEVYANDGDAQPVFSYAFKGEYKITLRRLLTAFTVLSLASVLFRRRGK